jgi:carbonic anhydrase
MTCPNATSPINIKLAQYSTCDLKCDYNFSYPIATPLTLTNKEVYLLIQTEQSADLPVVYNDNKYQIHELRLYTKSLHTYAGEYASAELIIHHKNVQGGNDLMVCIPIMNDNSSKGQSSELFRTIMHETAKQANSKNSETLVNITAFNLNKLIPLYPFYTYQGSLLYSPCNGLYNYIVFSKSNGGFMTMDDKTFSLFTQIIPQTHNLTTHTISDGNVFYNTQGPSTLLSKYRNNDEIYIDCQPTGADGESLVPVNKSIEPALVVDISTLFNNKYLKMVLPVLMIFCVVRFAGGILNSISNVGGAASRGGGGKGRK